MNVCTLSQEGNHVGRRQPLRFCYVCAMLVLSDGLLVLISSCKLLCLFRYPEESFSACSFGAQRS